MHSERADTQIEFADQRRAQRQQVGRGIVYCQNDRLGFSHPLFPPSVRDGHILQADQGCVKPECIIDQAGKLPDFRCRRVSFHFMILQLAKTSDRIKLVLPQQSFRFR